MNFDSGLQKLQESTVSAKSEASRNLECLFDNGSYEELGKFLKNGDNYCDVVTGYGTVEGVLTFAFSENIGVSGAMGKKLKDKIKNVYELSKKVGAPIVGFYNQDGAHIDEGVDVLEAYGELIALSASLSGVVPQIAVVSGECVGCSAVMASMADIVLMKKDATLYFTSDTVLHEKTVGTSFLAAKNGTAAYIFETDEEAREKVAEIIAALPQNNLAEPILSEYTEPLTTATSTEAYEVISSVTDGDSFFELYKEYGKDIVTGFARIGGVSVAVIATNTNGGKINAQSSSKAARFVRLADAFSVPVITLVDSVGILGNKEDELSGGVRAAAQLTHAYCEATTPKLTVITGAACGAAYIALCSKSAGIDGVFAWPTAYISALEPKSAVEFLKHDELKAGLTREEAEKKYIDTDASAFSAAENGCIDDIFAPSETAAKLSISLDMLSSKRVSTLDKKHSDIQL